MKLIVKNNCECAEYNDLLVLEITTNNFSYTIYPDHQNIVLNLVHAKIEKLNNEKKKINLFNNINGILFFKNNVIELFLY
jgi:hypothetical protein